MARFSILRRTVFGDKPPIAVVYALTSFDRRFMAILEEVRRLQETVDDAVDPDSADLREEVTRRRSPLGV